MHKIRLSGCFFHIAFFISILKINSIAAQDVDTMTFIGIPKDKYSLLMDDTYIIGGLNYSGIYYSNHFRNLSYATGLMLGVEQYFPTKGKFFTSLGAHFSNRAFRHHTPQLNVVFNNLYLDIPLTFSYELPVFRSLDFRILLGTFVSARLASWSRSGYDKAYIDDSSNFIYQTSDFKRTDFGWLFGLSMEHKNYLFRVRCISGWNNLDKKDQGMINGLSMEMGYFLFRDKRLKK